MQFLVAKYPSAAAATTAETNAKTPTELWCGVSTTGFTVYREGVYLYLRGADVKPLPYPPTDGSTHCCSVASLVSGADLDIADAAEVSVIDNGHLQ